MPRDPAAAIAWARAWKGSTAWSGRCESFVRQALDLDSVYPSAKVAWEEAGDKHPGDFYPPAGVPVFWALTGKNEPYGHVALSLGGGKAISSSDERGHPVVSEISIPKFTDDTAIFLGWAGFYHGVQLDYTRVNSSVASEGGEEVEELTPEQAKQLVQLVEQSNLTLQSLGDVAQRAYALEQKVNHIEQVVDHTLTALGQTAQNAWGANEHSRDAVQALNNK